MEILLNEHSLSGQFLSIDHFIDHGVINLIKVLSELKDEDRVLKKCDFYSYKVTQSDSIYDVLVGSASRSYDELRKFKIYLSKIIYEPFWEEDQKHDFNLEYIFNTISVSKSSLAEACERDRVVISFNHENFGETALNIKRNAEEINIDNLFEEGHYTTLLYKRGLSKDFSLKNQSLFKKTSLVRQGKAVYQDTSNGNYWYLDNLHKNHFEVFNANNDHIGIANLNGILDTSVSVKGRKL